MFLLIYEKQRHRFKKNMNYRLGVCFIAPLILVFTLIAVGIGIGPLGGKNAAQQEAKTSTSLIDSLEKNVHLAELLWVLCQQELMHANEVVEDIDFGFPEEKSGNKNYIFRRAKVDNSLLDCLRKKDLLFLLSEEEDRVPINRFTLYLDVIYARPRRDLIQSVGVSPAPSPAAISPATSRANPPSPPFFPDSSSQLTSDEESFSGVLSNKEKRTYKTVVNAVIVTAVATFIVSALLFLSYRRLCSGPGAGQGRNDVKPLLSLSTSAASSRKSFTLNSPSNRENPSNEALDTNSIDNNAKTGDFHLHSGLLGDSKISDPVGRTCSEANIRSVDNVKVAKLDTYGLLPLKPPPGRRISSIPNLGPGKTSPYSSAPPAPPPASPPPPPVPPPLKLSFGGGRPQAPAPPSIPFGSKTNPPPPPPVGVVIPPKSRPLPDIGSSNHEAEAPKAKLKPFFWDKVLTNPDHSMVWHQIKSGSFQFNEEMIETLFGYAPAGKTKSPLKESSSQDPPSTNYIQIIDRKKSQNLSILLKALNVTTEEVCDALQEGNELPSELIQSLLKMAPTTDEELKLRLYSGDLSRLGPAERFLKVIVDIPSVFLRLESLLFMCTLQEEEKVLKESFSILEAACMEVRGSKLFLKLLEAVLKTGNRMNDGTYRGGAQAFKLDTLLKLSDVKGLDGKTTLLHFVVQEIVRSEGVRAAREKNPSMSSIDSDNLSEDTEDFCQSIGMQVVSGLGDELENVKRAAVLDLNTLTGTVSKLAEALVKARDILNSEMKNTDEENGFYQTLRSFVQNAEVDIRWLLEEEKRIMALVKSTGDYFHGSSAKDEGLRIFVIVRDFLVILERVCRELENSPKKLTRCPIKHDMKAVHPEAHQSVSPDTRERICTLIKNRRIDDSSSDDDNL